MTLSEIVSELRENRGFTLDELAERASLSKSFISKIENGEFDEKNISLDTLIKLADGFSIKVKEILGLLKVISDQPSTPSLSVYLRQQYGMDNKEAVRIIENLIDHLKK